MPADDASEDTLKIADSMPADDTARYAEDASDADKYKMIADDDSWPAIRRFR